MRRAVASAAIGWYLVWGVIGMRESARRPLPGPPPAVATEEARALAGS